MAVKIALSAGHGKNTAGKRCMKKLDSAETREWVLNARIADKVQKLLEGYEIVENCRNISLDTASAGGGNVENCRKDSLDNRVLVLRVDDVTGQTDIPLSDRVAAAAAFGAELYLSLHHNAGVLGGSGGGIVAYVHPQAGEEAKLWQRQLYEALVEATGLKGNRVTPLAQKNLKELRLAAMPAVLLELGFMDSRTDVPVILSESYADAAAEAIVSVIAERAGLTPKPPEPTQTTLEGESKPPLSKGGMSQSDRGDSSTPTDEATEPPLSKGGGSADAEPGGFNSPDEEPTTQPTLYRVQVGAFSNRQNAEKLKQRLAAAGFPEAYIRADP